MRRKRLLLGIMVIIGVIGVGIAIPAGKEKFSTRDSLPVETATARRGRFTATVLCSGRLEASNVYEVLSSISGRIQRLHVREWDLVEPGQRLASFDPSELILKAKELDASLAETEAALAELAPACPEGETDPCVAQARARLEAAKMRLSELEAKPDEAELAQARADLEEAAFTLKDAQDNLSRLRRLFQAGAIARKAVEDALSKEGAARARYLAAKRRYESIASGPDQAQLAQARSEVKESETELQLALSAAKARERKRQAMVLRASQLDEARRAIEGKLQAVEVRAKASGVVSAIMAKEGTRVEEGAHLMTILDPGSLRLIARADEMDVIRLKPGQTVEVSCDHLPGQSFPGKVQRISPNATLEGGTPKFTVEVSVEDPMGLLRPGMTADAEIVVYDKPDAISIPSQAVVSRGPGRKVAFVVMDGRVREKEIETGEETPTTVEIVSGILPGDEVITGSYQALKGLKDGEPVRRKREGGTAGNKDSGWLTIKVE